MTLKAVTANRLRDGRVVYLSQSGNWSQSLEDSRIARDETELEALLDQAEVSVLRNEVVGPYAIDVLEQDSGYLTTRCREEIRSTGPSRRTDAA
ncbi:DUF2849 domain-containing protein [Fodinicurvata sediminis]|uniref:DUF2849 domain-containing protein n=1 Tax=Fodinicurvata sediminis TaxID=1121832 RepID=UPI0003B70D00|nr:DUF2849 domain-containing protein [Fodinicurvata sediminis]